MIALTPRRMVIAVTFVVGLVSAALAPSEDAVPPAKRSAKSHSAVADTPPTPKAARDIEVPQMANYKRPGGAGVQVADVFEARPVPGMATPAPKPPEPPKLPFFFAGVIEESGRAKAVLVQGDQLFMVAKGEQFGGAYQLEEIGMEKLGVIYLPLGARQSLPLGEAK